MTGLALWQRVVYYFGMALLVSGFVWGLYRMAVIHGCPTARFNDLSLIALGLGIAIAPLHPFAPAPAYLSLKLRRNRNLAYGAWVLSLAGMVFAILAMWFRLSNLVWFMAMIPAAYYMWFGIEVGRTAVSADLGGRASLPADDAGTGGPRAADLVGAALMRPGDASENTGRTSAAPTAESRQKASAPREEECRLKANAPREEESRQKAGAPREEECRLQAGAPRDEEECRLKASAPRDEEPRDA